VNILARYLIFTANLQNMKLESITESVIELCYEVGSFIKSEQSKISSKDVETKDLNSFVSYVDKQAEEKLVNQLKNILPQAGFITEEDTEDVIKDDFNWIIDPLDGTTNYLHDLPVFAISIGLQDKKGMLIGVVYEMGFDEMFSAFRDGGAKMNGKPILVKKATDLKDTLLATGFPYHDFVRMPKYMKLLEDCFQNTRGLRRFGSAATDLAYVACGRFDGFFEYGLNPWDVAAGALLVQEAGGMVRDFQSGNDFVFGREILAGSTSIFPSLEKMVQKNMNE
jgi:myo-inositol-1(or 4)-monophosphatase